MKANVVLFDPKDGSPATPKELQIAVGYAVKRVAEIMQLHGIHQIDNVLVRLGAVSFTDVTMEPLPVDPPMTYLVARKRVARLMADYVAIMGVKTITLEMEPKDLETLRQEWAKVSTDTLNSTKDPAQ